MSQPSESRPIGVFDSGVGGMSVLRALRADLPAERFTYLGDTARLPYGTKSAATVERYALQAAQLLVARDVKALVIACNTASAAALPAIRARFAHLPVIGVVEPGAQAAVQASRTGRIVVIGTEATVRGGAYQRAISALRADAQVQSVACQMFVALAEEGWSEGAIAQASADQYLSALFASRSGADGADTLVLGCTHFPMLLGVIRQSVGAHIHIVDSAATTARAVQRELRQRGLLQSSPPLGEREALQFLATDGVPRFCAVGGRFLGHGIEARDVELVDL